MVGWEGWILDTFSAYSSILIFWTLNFLFTTPDPCVHISTSTYLGYPDCLQAIFLSLDNWIFLHQTERTPNYIFIMLRKFTLSGKPVGKKTCFYIQLSNSKCATSKEYPVIKGYLACILGSAYNLKKSQRMHQSLPNKWKLYWLLLFEMF